MRRHLISSIPIIAVAVFACSDSTGPDHGAGSIVIDLPASTSVGRSFTLGIRAVAEGGQTDTRAAGVVTLSVQGGTITPAVVTLTAGEGDVEALITGITGSATVRAEFSDRSTTRTLQIATPDERLAGSDESPANAAIPDIVFAAHASDYSNDHPELAGLSVSFNTLLLAPASSATTGAINDLLDAVNAEIVGGIPGGPDYGGILYVRLPTTTHAQMDAMLITLSASPVVEAVVQETLMDANDLPRNGSTPLQEWTWEREPTGGNWMWELARVPQMWSLKPAIEKAMGAEFRMGGS